MLSLIDPPKWVYLLFLGKKKKKKTAINHQSQPVNLTIDDGYLCSSGESGLYLRGERNSYP